MKHIAHCEGLGTCGFSQHEFPYLENVDSIMYMYTLDPNQSLMSKCSFCCTFCFSFPLREILHAWFIYFHLYELMLLFSCQVVFNSLLPPGLQHASLSFTISQSLFKLMSIELVMMPSNHLILCHQLLLLPSIFPTSRVLSNEYLGLIFFRVDWFDLLAIQGTLKSHLQHHSLKASLLQN